MTDNSSSHENFADLFNDNGPVKKQLSPGQKITAVVVDVTQDSVFLDVGEKSEGFTNLKRGYNSDRIAPKIDVGTMVAGLSGWGVFSSKKSGNGNMIDRDSFNKLDRKNRLRRFIKWSNGELEKKAGKEFSFQKKRDLN